MKKSFGLFTLMLSLVLIVLAGCGQGKQGAAGSSQDKKEEIVVNIGVQHAVTPLVLAWQKGWFEEEFSKAGAKVNWVQIGGGPPQFEAIASNRIDFAVTGNTAVIVGQAANIPFKEIFVGNKGTKNVGILVPKNSAVTKTEQLKGKKVAVAKGSSGYDVLYTALDKAGLKPTDLEIIQLQPDEAKAAFVNGSVAAWSVGEPYLSTEVVKNGAKVIANGETLQYNSPAFHIVRTKFAETHPELVGLYIKVMDKALGWQTQNMNEAVDVYAKGTKLDPEVVRAVIQNVQFTTSPVTEEFVKGQQNLVDFLYKMEGVSKKVNASEVVDNSYIDKVLKEAKQGK